MHKTIDVIGCFVLGAFALWIPDGVVTADDMTATKLKRLYRSAGSEAERLSLCVRAIDKGIISRYGPVKAVDTLFGTSFAMDLPTKAESPRTGIVHFAPVLDPPKDSRAGAVSSVYQGWYLAVQFDFEGNIESYYLSNLHKPLGCSSPPIGPER